MQAVWDANCTVTCHNAGNPSAQLLLTAGMSYGELVNTQGCDLTVRLVTDGGILTNSMLWRKLSNELNKCGGVMPQGTAGLRSEDAAAMTTVEDWLKQGAKP